MLPDRVKIGESVLVQKLNDEAILLNLDTQHYFGLNSTAARMWDLMLETGCTAGVVSRIADEAAVDPETVSADLERLVASLVNAGLLQAVSA